ncbi:MAG: prolyl oligopeptidase family serine peptidase [Spirochaetes bacterium]|nr:prolyl oligopeptidase family serine peptidase [Spirochaetota bacterium]
MKKKITRPLAAPLAALLAAVATTFAMSSCGHLSGARQVDIVSYQMVVEGFDWGPGVTRLILALAAPVSPATINNTGFAVSVNREPGFRPVFDDPFETVTQTVELTGVFLSNAAGNPVSGNSAFVTLTLEVHPGRGLNPFTFALAPMGNNWASPFEVTILTTDGDFTPARSGVITPIADLFEMDGVFLHEGIALQYAAFVPPQAAASDRPLIVWLHGGGEGSRNLTAAPDVALLGNRVTQLAAPHIQGIMGGAHVFVPQSPTMWFAGAAENAGVSNYEAALFALLDHYIATTPGIDRDRIYVGGCSNGGFMTMRLLFERPEMFAAAWPIALGYREEWLTPAKIASITHVPIWMVHDLNDPVASTPHADSERLYNLLNAAGAPDVYLTSTDGLFSGEFFDDYGSPWAFDLHWSWVPTLNNEIARTAGGGPTIFEWMAAQSRLSLP